MRFEDLEDFLLSDRAPESSMLLSDLDGFITGLAVSPVAIMPSEWFAEIWGQDGKPEFVDNDEATRVASTILRRFHENCEALDTGREDALNPIYWISPDGTRIAADWAEGFMDAMRMRPDAWQPLFQDSHAILNLAPILSLTQDENGNLAHELQNPDIAEIHANAPDLIPEAVIRIDRFWRQRHGDHASRPSQNVQPVPRQKVGRNELCPCGSGKKYKKCCGG